MDVLLYVLLALCGLALVLALFVLARNNRVCEFRLLVLKHLGDGTTADLRDGKDWKWRFDAFDSVSYEKTLFSVKRLRASNFWSDLSFVDGYDVTL